MKGVFICLAPGGENEAMFCFLCRRRTPGTLIGGRLAQKISASLSPRHKKSFLSLGPQ